MTEPLTLVVIAAAVGGTAGKLAEKAWDSGEKWLSTYFQDHHPKAIKKAEQNALAFLDDLAKRVNRLELATADSQQITQQIESALEDPAFSATLKDSLLVSACTQNRTTHRILAHLISERLCCTSDNILALTIPLACRTVVSLTNKQLCFLATGVVLEHLLPAAVSNVEPEVKDQFAIDWLKEKLPFVLPQECITGIDLIHMEGLSCFNLTRTMLGGDRLHFFLRRKLETSGAQFDNFVMNTTIGKQFESCWNRKLSHVLLTSIGLLIGICAFEELTGSQVDVQIYFK